ncbi:MAG: hypothetical protein AAF458_20630 [Pseudomonadota bacterium]
MLDERDFPFFYTCLEGPGAPRATIALGSGAQQLEVNKAAVEMLAEHLRQLALQMREDPDLAVPDMPYAYE